MLIVDLFVAIELNQSRLYTPLILKANIILSSSLNVAEMFMSGIVIRCNCALYLLISIITGAIKSHWF